MSSGEFFVRGRRVVVPGGERPASLRIRGGRIAAVGGPDDPAPGAEVLDFEDAVVMPGLVDTHVHVNEPGRTDWEGFASATRAAAAGGVTTIFDMPLNSVPPTTSVAALEVKRAAADGQCAVDVGFWGGVVPGNTGELAAMSARGVRGFKCFLAPSGVEEFPAVGEADLRATLPSLAESGSVLLVHAEDGAQLGECAAGTRDYGAYLASRPPAAEGSAIALLVRLAGEFRTPIHVVHLSAADALAQLERAHTEGLLLTAETCPHYLFFDAEAIPPGATEFKCAPPIRGRENRERLWKALGEGLIEMVVSDHSPSPPEGKRRESGDFAGAWGGISSLELALPAVWSAARRRGVNVASLAEWMGAGPARLAGLAGRKGTLSPGADADFVVWRPEESFEVRPDALQHRHKLTPYAGRTLFGRVEATFLRGEKIYEMGRFVGPPRGEILLTR
ncbi:MAG TPA: allantoinase AllB [Thermoanaerobaculia bacterium]|nr:allantoinase AllB [Thermoanaerobaculia bacterium]